jgi:hypothetical protein
MLFIRFVPNCGFVRKKHWKRTGLKRLFKLCSLLIGSYNINIGADIINTMLNSFMTYSRLRSMMNLLLRIITNIMLGLLLFLRYITMSRISISLFFPWTKIQRKMVNPQSADAMGVRIGNLQRWWEMIHPLTKEGMLSARHVDATNILLKNAVLLST